MCISPPKQLPLFYRQGTCRAVTSQTGARYFDGEFHRVGGQKPHFLTGKSDNGHEKAIGARSFFCASRVSSWIRGVFLRSKETLENQFTGADVWRPQMKKTRHIPRAEIVHGSRNQGTVVNKGHETNPYGQTKEW